MKHFREFNHKLRLLNFGDPHIMIGGDLTPKLIKYVKSFDDTKFTDGEYHTYYGEIKQSAIGFISYWNETINKVIIESDHYKNVMNREKLLMLWKNSIDTHKQMQINFNENFLPAQSEEENQIYNHIEHLYNEHMEKFIELRMKIEKLDRPEKIVAFCETHFEMGLKNKHSIFDFTLSYISSLFDNYSDRIKISLEEMSSRTQHNLKMLNENSEEEQYNLFLDLYLKNQELLRVTRLERQPTLDVIELIQTIRTIKEEIVADAEQKAPLIRLREEATYWKTKLSQVIEIRELLKKLKTEQQNVLRQEKIYNSMKCTELPGEKHKRWENMEANIKKRKEFITERISATQKSLMTFFSLRQMCDRMVYGPNSIGLYILCEYGHQVYIFDNGLKYCHLNCDGELKQYLPKNKYYHDLYGRHIIDENNEKIYQLAPCTSCYRLGKDTLMHKVTKDCGHSEIPNKNCMMEFQDIDAEEILPTVKPIDIKNSLDTETVKYLWDSFGGILYEALHDVAIAEPRNPIHVLAHKLLYHKYKRSTSELRQKRQEADEYRANFYQKRKEVAVAASAAHRAKQVRRRKPEESDDTSDWVAYNHHLHGLQYINSLNSC